MPSLGPIPPALGELTALEILDLSRNFLSGESDIFVALRGHGRDAELFPPDKTETSKAKYVAAAAVPVILGTCRRESGYSCDQPGAFMTRLTSDISLQGCIYQLASTHLLKRASEATNLQLYATVVTRTHTNGADATLTARTAWFVLKQGPKRSVHLHQPGCGGCTSSPEGCLKV